MEICVEKVKPIRLGKNNLIILRRYDIANRVDEISNEVENDVAPKMALIEPEPNIIYGLKVHNKARWHRAILRFTRNDGVKVMDLMDSSGSYDFKIRQISSTKLLNLPPGEFNFMVFAVNTTKNSN